MHKSYIQADVETFLALAFSQISMIKHQNLVGVDLKKLEKRCANC